MSTPSLTMLTATIQRSVERVNAWSFSAARASVCRTTVGSWPVRLAQHLRDRAGVLAVGGDDEPARVAVAAGAEPSSRSCAAARMRGRPSASSIEIAVR